MDLKVDTVILISADAEWSVIKKLFPDEKTQHTSYGEWFLSKIGGMTSILMHGGWGKVAAAGSAQFAIDRWHPELLVNLGTCGGFSGRIKKGQLILAKRTIIYDIIEQMGDGEQAILDRSVEMDLSWLKSRIPENILVITLLSADRDILPADIPMLIDKYGAAAADWESGAIAWVAHRNKTKCLILRGVTDLVGENGGEVYGDYQSFVEKTNDVMRELIDLIGWWDG
jgi:adenosylhomocysteine nucleosidase